MVAPICSLVQLPFIYLNLSATLIFISRFSCSNRVSYHIFVYYFITRIRAIRLAKRKLPSGFRQVLTIVSRRTRHPFSMTLVPTQIKPGSVTAVASSAARVHYCEGPPHRPYCKYLLSMHDSHHFDVC